MMLIATLAPKCNEHHEGMQTEAAVCVCLGVCVRISGLFIHVRVSVCVGSKAKIQRKRHRESC